MAKKAKAKGKAVSVRMVVTVKRAGLPVEDELPWDEFSSESFGVSDDVILPENQSFGVLENGDEVWPELEEWLEFHPDEEEDIEYLPISTPTRSSPMFRLVTQRLR